MRPVLKFYRIYSVLLDALERRSKLTLFGWSLILTVLVAGIDYTTGDYSFILFYLAPIFIASWFVGSIAGGIICIASFGASLLANPYRYILHHYQHPSYYYWDLALEFTYLVLLSLMFSALKARFNAEREKSRIDPLTGALNRRALAELATYEIARISRQFRPLSLAFIDLDNFKIVNDDMGHAEGDKVLCEVAATLKKSLRQGDTITRVGGDEFVLMLPETGEEAAGAAIRKVRENLLDAMTRNSWPVTFSIGIITHETPPESIEEMIDQVDRLMYSIKKTQKDGILHHIQRREA